MDLTVDWQKMYEEMVDDRNKWADCARERLIIIRQHEATIEMLRDDANAMRDRMVDPEGMCGR